MNYKRKRIAATVVGVSSDFAAAIAAIDDDLEVAQDNTSTVVVREKFRIKLESGYYLHTFKLSVTYGTQTVVISEMLPDGNLVVSLAKNTDCIDLQFRCSNTAEPYFNADLLFFTSGAADAWCYGVNADANSRPFALASTLRSAGSSVTLGSAVNRLPYTYDPESVSFDSLAGKVFVSSDLITASYSGLIDVSTVTGGQLYPVDDRVFYALDSHTLIEV